MIDIPGVDQVNALSVGKRVPVKLLKAGHFRHNAPAAVAWLDRRIHRPPNPAGGLMENVSRFVIAGGKFHAKTDTDIAVVVRFRIEQPDVAYQTDVAKAAGAGGKLVNEIVFVIAGAIAVLHRDFERDADSRRKLINRADVEPINMGIGV